MNVLEMTCLRSLVVVSRMDGVRNEEVRRSAGVKSELSSRVDLRASRFLGHLKRIVYRTARKVLLVEVIGGWVRGRSRLGWMDDVKMALGSNGMTVEAVRK